MNFDKIKTRGSPFSYSKDDFNSSRHYNNIFEDLDGNEFKEQLGAIYFFSLFAVIILLLFI